MSEILEIVDENGSVIGTAPRSEIHGNSRLLHRVIHVFIFNSYGELLLQKRSMRKDVAPGKWDTSVGGHIDRGETLEQALFREAHEELDIESINPDFLYSYIHSNDYESELVYTYRCTYDGEITFNPEEIDDVRFWGMDDIRKDLRKEVFSNNFEHEFEMYSNFIYRKP